MDGVAVRGDIAEAEALFDGAKSLFGGAEALFGEGPSSKHFLRKK